MTIKDTEDKKYLNVTIVTHSEGKDMPVGFKYKKDMREKNPWHLMFCFKHKKQKFLTLLLGMGVGQETAGLHYRYQWITKNSMSFCSKRK